MAAAALQICQWNCRSLSNKWPDCSIYFPHFDIILLQETWLRPHQLLTLNNYNFVRKDRNSVNSGGSVACIINRNLQYRSLNPGNINNKLEWLLIEVKVESKIIHLFNCYKPPDTSLSLAEWSTLLTVLEAFPNLIMGGDVNAHHHLWGSDLSNNDGNNLAQAINNSDLCILNSGSSTRLHTAQFRTSVPDVSLTTPNMLAMTEWSVEDDARGSDHFPIVISIRNMPFLRSKVKPRISTNKVKWDRFAESVTTRSQEYTVNSDNYIEIYNELVCDIKGALKDAGARLPDLRRTGGRDEHDSSPPLPPGGHQSVRRRQKRDVKHV